MQESLLNELLANPDYKILRRLSNEFESILNQDPKIFVATIVDLETMGMDAQTNEIIEIGLLSFAFTNGDGVINILDSYNELQDPGKLIPPEITKITGITNGDVQGKAIDWNTVHNILNQSHLIICHNSRFDRNFLELQTPAIVKKTIERKPFGCTLSDIDWKERGYESSKLEYLNFKLGYFYEGHRAIIDCWATLNLLLNEDGAFDELKANVRKKEVLLCAENAAFEKKDLLQSRKYRWSDGKSRLPKCWYIVLKSEHFEEEKEWLDTHIYERPGASETLTAIEITAHKRYSFRAEQK
ncbi:3'-5' exonuclease [Legionella brunensis]|uniref:Putative exonuclease n=1 Tax=Legionella brunensis TaxID=29422 RepID=A0A0W0SK31_9GAMM|nr:3'-5' exonuclease [Legionella brunensis]KTC83715.1 putative exonuclease [Legionella brunensis]